MKKTITYTKATKTKSSKVLINGEPKQKFPSRRRADHAVFNKIKQREEFIPGTPNHKVTIIQRPDK